MRRIAAVLAFALSLATTQQAGAQDYVGFDRSSFGSVVLSRNQSAGIADFDLELAVGSYNNEAITNYSADSIFSRLGLAVGRLDILTDAGIFPCTAFIVDDRHILTNHHCVPGIIDNPKAGATRIDAVQFVAGYRQQGVVEGTKTYVVSTTPVEAHEDLDYALLEVMGNPAAEWGTLRISDREPQDNDPYWVIGHPMGEAQRISREQCRANKPARSGFQLLHTCDTLPGNSGSPVIDASLQAVIGLHHAGSKRDAVNFAIPMRDIIQRSAVLEAALAPVGGDTRTDAPRVDSATVDPCDAMWTESRAFNQCFAYKAYLAQCGDHTQAWLARGFVEDQCAVSVAVAPPVQPVPETPQPAVVANQPLLRPWCGASGLNATERAICDSPTLAGLDAQLETAYRAQSHVSAAEQRQWLGTRNACGADANCIAQEMISRTALLSAPPAARPSTSEAGSTRLVRGSYTLPDGRCFVTVASRATIAEATAFIGQWFPGNGGVRVFQSSNGWYGITVQTIETRLEDSTLARLKGQGAIPGDSYCSSGRNFVAEVIWQAGAASGGSGGDAYTMYVDNNNSGGLNVRNGPGTQYGDFAELAPGTAVRVTGTSGDWSKVILPGGRDGWVFTPLLTSAMPRVQTCWGRVIGIQPRSTGGNSSFLAMRSDAGTSATKISELYLNDQVRVLARKDGWARVQCMSGGCQNPSRGQPGATGWSSQNYLSISCN